jgi:flagellar biosynthesis/type III secretory pathway protein FliH
MGLAEEQTQTPQGAQTEDRPARRPGWSWKRWALVGTGILLVAGAAGTGAYLYGKSTGEDLDAAREEGTAAGQEQGATKGAEQGYAQGFEEGREQAYDESYGAAYREAYLRAFDEAGLERPEKVKVPGP